MTRQDIHDLLLGVAVIGLAYAVYHHQLLLKGVTSQPAKTAPRAPMTTDELFAALTAGAVGYQVGGF